MGDVLLLDRSHGNDRITEHGGSASMVPKRIIEAFEQRPTTLQVVYRKLVASLKAYIDGTELSESCGCYAPTTIKMVLAGDVGERFKDILRIDEEGNFFIDYVLTWQLAQNLCTN